MSKQFRTCSLDQPLLLPPSLQDWLPEKHLARFIADVTDQLDLSQILAGYGRGDGRGMAAYHPVMMVRILLYGYCLGMVSSRQAGTRDLPGRGVPVLGGGSASRSRFHRQLSADAFAGTGRVVHAGVAIMREGGIGEVGACGHRWDETESQRQQTQGDELRADDRKRETVAGGSGEATGAGSTG